MNIEYETKYLDIDKDEMRARLRIAGAVLVRPEFLQRRIPFYLPGDTASENSWLRVRDEGDKITLSYKSVDGDKIHNQQEICIVVDNFDNAVELLKQIGCQSKSYQETKRELWLLDNVEITIDEWPFLEPFVEVEGESDETVRNVSEKLGFDYAKAVFGGVGKLYAMKYKIPAGQINSTDKIVFEMENPFLKMI